MELEVNKDKCIGCLNCISEFPDNFEETDSGVEVKEQPTNEEQLKGLKEACPMEAIEEKCTE